MKHLRRFKCHSDLSPFCLPLSPIGWNDPFELPACRQQYDNDRHNSGGNGVRADLRWRSQAGRPQFSLGGSIPDRNVSEIIPDGKQRPVWRVRERMNCGRPGNRNSFDVYSGFRVLELKPIEPPRAENFAVCRKSDAEGREEFDLESLAIRFDIPNEDRLPSTDCQVPSVR